MRLQIVEIQDRGVPNRERLHIRVLVDTNLYYYIAFDSVRQQTGITTQPFGVLNIPAHAFWFPARQVRAGDQVLLYTGPGQPSQVDGPGGIKVHVFFWGNPRTLWAFPNSVAVLFEVLDWHTYDPTTALPQLPQP